MMFYRKHERVTLDCGGPEKSMTKQEFRDESDINWIIKRYGPSELTNLSGQRQPMFGDFTGAEDFATAKEMVQDAMEAFDTLPSRLRAAHDNDPQKFLDWFDQASDADLRSAGLLPREAVDIMAPVAPEEVSEEPPDTVGT
jgi:hypothetical protein